MRPVGKISASLVVSCSLAPACKKSLLLSEEGVMQAGFFSVVATSANSCLAFVEDPPSDRK